MPILAGAIAWLLALVPAFVAKILIALGIGVISYVGVNTLLANLSSVVMGNAGSVGGDLASFMGLAQVDVCISMVLSALSIRISLITANGVISKVSFTNKSIT
ncbi:MAG: DUF2523 domain-containing protein [Betaproteobacteria bacterium]|nr:MAG: DUF2523 domain-containing protein [Betaproteobacteria bacterium]